MQYVVTHSLPLTGNNPLKRKYPIFVDHLADIAFIVLSAGSPLNRGNYSKEMSATLYSEKQIIIDNNYH